MNENTNYTLEKDSEAKIADALTSIASSLKRIESYIISDPGVRFFSVDNYANDIHIDFNELLQLNNIEINVQFV